MLELLTDPFSSISEVLPRTFVDSAASRQTVLIPLKVTVHRASLLGFKFWLLHLGIVEP